MSINEHSHYDIYRTGEATPDWFRNERYAYCEDFYGRRVKNSKKRFMKFITKLQSFMF